MTLFDHETLSSTSLAKLDIWRCGDGCGFHLRAGNVVLTFTDEELEAFLRAAGGCYLGETCGHVAAPAGPDKLREKREAASREILTSVLEH